MVRAYNPSTGEVENQEAQRLKVSFVFHREPRPVWIMEGKGKEGKKREGKKGREQKKGRERQREGANNNNKTYLVLYCQKSFDNVLSIYKEVATLH